MPKSAGPSCSGTLARLPEIMNEKRFPSKKQCSTQVAHLASKPCSGLKSTQVEAARSPAVASSMKCLLHGRSRRTAGSQWLTIKSREILLNDLAPSGVTRTVSLKM